MSEPLSMSPETDSRSGGVWKFWLLIVIVGLIGLVGISLLAKLTGVRPPVAESGVKGPSLPEYAKITQPLVTTERNGQNVSSEQLRGKITLYSYTFTRCPRGCLGVISELLKLRDQFASHPKFHLVSVAVGPEIDTPEVLKSFAEGLGVSPNDPWWFVSAKDGAERSFMTDQLKLEPTKEVPEKERLHPYDLYEHDLRVTLVDGNNTVRGYYNLLPLGGSESARITAEMSKEKLLRDLKTLLQK